jgi:hypothetical protein
VQTRGNLRPRKAVVSVESRRNFKPVSDSGNRREQQGRSRAEFWNSLSSNSGCISEAMLFSVISVISVTSLWRGVTGSGNRREQQGRSRAEFWNSLQ